MEALSLPLYYSDIHVMPVENLMCKCFCYSLILHQRSIDNHLQAPLAACLDAGIDAVDVA